MGWVVAILIVALLGNLYLFSGYDVDGDIATFIYNGSQYHLISIDRWQSDIDSSITNINTFCVLTQPQAFNEFFLSNVVKV